MACNGTINKNWSLSFLLADVCVFFWFFNVGLFEMLVCFLFDMFVEWKSFFRNVGVTFLVRIF